MPVYIVPSTLPLFALKFENPNSKLATESVTYFFYFLVYFFYFCDVYNFCSASEQHQFPLWSSLVMREDLPVLRRMIWMMTKRNCHDLVVSLVNEIVI